jgi:RNA polymerase sigma factor (sigma-70 family)
VGLDVANDGNDDDEGSGVPTAERRERLTRLVAGGAGLDKSEIALFDDEFAIIYDTHYDLVWKLFSRRSLSVEDVEELVQDTFLTFYRQIFEVGFADVIPAMLTGIGKFLYFNFARRAKRSPFDGGGLPSSRSEPPETPVDLARAVDLRMLCAALLPQLPDELRIVAEKVILGGLTNPEAATALNLPLSTVKNRLVAAKARLGELAEKLLPPSQRGPA